MSYAARNVAIKQYSQMGAQSISYASPHKLVHMLMEGVLDRIAMARGHMNRGEVADKCSCISRSIAIVDTLRGSLDQNVGGAIAANLDDLYDYMSRQLALANARNDAALLDEVARLLGEIKQAWEAIPEDVIAEAEAVRKKQWEKIQAPAVG